jgi:hypothetical protein
MQHCIYHCIVCASPLCYFCLDLCGDILVAMLSLVLPLPLSATAMPLICLSKDCSYDHFLMLPIVFLTAFA